MFCIIAVLGMLSYPLRCYYVPTRVLVRLEPNQPPINTEATL